MAWAMEPYVVATLAPAYAPRRPTETVLYGVVLSQLETFLAHTRETYAKPLPRYVEHEFRSYLKCGVFAHGFVKCRCESCGHDLLVAYSCKVRGICPSCSSRRMANGAAHLVDRVVPDVPLRQFVLSLRHSTASSSTPFSRPIVLAQNAKGSKVRSAAL